MPSPQRDEQSPSFIHVQLLGQQPSPERQSRISVELQASVQAFADPVASTRKQAELMGHRGQLFGGSQVSPGSTTPLPHVVSQSRSSAAVAPFGQQPSPPRRSVIVTDSQRAMQPLPRNMRGLQASSPRSQRVGQAPLRLAAIAVSQRSFALMRPSPQLLEPTPNESCSPLSFVSLLLASASASASRISRRSEGDLGDVQPIAIQAENQIESAIRAAALRKVVNVYT